LAERRIRDTLGALSVVGAGISIVRERPPRLDGALGARDAGRGDRDPSFRITWMIDRDRLDEGVRLLHNTFIEAQAQPVP
jgi:hypothetical protein